MKAASLVTATLNLNKRKESFCLILREREQPGCTQSGCSHSRKASEGWNRLNRQINQPTHRLWEHNHQQ
jgi:hypothetical protein